MSALDIQVGGSHYKDYKIQPQELYNRFSLGIKEASILKYVLRYKDKDGFKDLQKAKHYVQLIRHYDKPVGSFLDQEYVENFCRENDLSEPIQYVIESVLSWVSSGNQYYLGEIENTINNLIRDF